MEETRKVAIKQKFDSLKKAAHEKRGRLAFGATAVVMTTATVWLLGKQYSNFADFLKEKDMFEAYQNWIIEDLLEEQ